MNEVPGSTSSAPGDSSNAHAEALHFLEVLLNSNPDIDDASLSSEIENLLGRNPPIVAQKVSPRWAAKLDADPDETPNFRWYQQLLANAPAVDDGYTQEAARRVEAGLFAEERLSHIDRSQSSRRELIELDALVNEGREAWSFMVLSNLRLVFHWSKGVARSVHSDWAQDAFQVGCIGLMRGLQGWDYQMGYKLSTFVSWHVRQAIQRWRANDVMIIRVPVHVWEALDSEDGSLTSKVRESADRAQDLASLEAMIYDRGEDEPWDGGIQASEDRIDRGRLLQKLLQDLDERSLDIIERRFGIRDDLDRPMTLDEIGDIWGVTRERIRQLENKTFAILRARAGAESSTEVSTKRVRRKKRGGELLDTPAGSVPVSDSLPT